eukprot:CAMPEP_0113893688 /NCGR_PEP_ID=MMETSP0780_2-20120614/16247_1 /TAXON_ID=652834 /ORGANISM="Palpitomonas bilix" /LENGTH=841 /DNA_ID=CAMNT_0000884037 /DNA_START=85 /DNA_END=2610 /DNA_ORIENTATION=+ /assembly_acc=CAM_ASM_000599
MKFLAIVCLVLVASASADVTGDITTAGSSVTTNLGSRSAAKTTKETNLDSAFTAVTTAQTTLKSAQETFLAEQAEYWTRYAAWEAATANETAKDTIRQEKLDIKTAAISWKAGSSTDETHVCDAEVTVGGETIDRPLCWSDAHVAALRAQYVAEVAHIDAVVADLGQEINEYSESSAASAQLLELKTKLNADIATLDKMSSFHQQFIADVTAIHGEADAIHQVAVEHLAWRLARKNDQFSTMNTASTAVDTAGANLKTALDAWNTQQAAYATTASADLSALDGYRAQLETILNELDTQAVTAKSALFVERGAYASAPAVNLRTDFTMEAWVYFDPTKHDHAALPVISQARVVGADDTKFVFQLKLRGGPRSVEQEGTGEYLYYFWDFRMGSPESPGYAVRLWGSEYQPRGWTHVAVSVKTISTVPNAFLFVDGAQQSTKTFSASRWSSPEPMLFGKIVDNAGTRFSMCAFDEFRVRAEGISDASGLAMYSTHDPTDTKLRIYLRFDELYDNPSEVPTALQTRLIDSSVNRLDGTYYYPDGHATFAKYIDSQAFSTEDNFHTFSEYGIHLDSKPEHQNYVAVPTQDLTDTFTIEMWLKNRGSIADHYPKVSQAVRDGWTRTRFVFTLEMVDGSGGNCAYEFKMGNCQTSDDHDAGTCNYALQITSDEFSGCGDWHHVAVMVTDNEVAKIFVDGVCGDEANEPAPSGTCVKRHVNGELATRLSSSETIQVGRLVDDVQFNSVEADVDEIRIWNRARTQEQIQQYMKRTLPKSYWDQQITGADYELVSYYQLEEPAGHRPVYDRVVRNVGELKDGSASLQDGFIYGTRVRAAKAELFDQTDVTV